MPRAQKEDFIAAMRNDVQRAQGVLFVDYTGLTVAQANSLRSKLRESKVTYKVVKNTLMTRVLTDTPYADAAKVLKGTPTGVILGYEDPVTPAKVTFAFMKECENLKIKGGVVDNKAISPQEAKALSDFPSREELQAQVVGLAQSPGRNLLSQVKSPSGKIVGAIEALVKKLEG